jgi:hypothetical protein
MSAKTEAIEMAYTMSEQEMDETLALMDDVDRFCVRQHIRRIRMKKAQGLTLRQILEEESKIEY